MLTGLIHIGIALGIFAAYYSVFIRHISEIIGFGRDAVAKKLDIRNSTPSRKFTYYTLIPYIFMLFYLIPTGSSGNVYQLFSSFSRDGNLISEGVCFFVTASVLLYCAFVLRKNQKGRMITLPVVLLLSLIIFITLPFAGLSLSVGIICVAIICGVNRNFAFRYFVSISVPVLIVTGIIEMANCVTYTTVAAGIIAVVIAAGMAFLTCRFLKWSLRNFDFKYFSYYNYALAALSLITGLVEYIIK